MGSITENAESEKEREERKQTQRKLHDLYVKQVMSRPANAASWLKFVLPEWYSEHVDWNTLTVLSSIYVSKKLKERIGDLAYRANLVDSDEQVWFLVEHQSRPDATMLVRAMEYSIGATRLYVDGHPDTDTDGSGDTETASVPPVRKSRTLQQAVRTPAIVNTVLFSGPTPRRWGYQLQSTRTTGLSTDTLKWIGDDLLQCRIYLDDAVNCTVEQLRARPMTAAMRMVTIGHKIALQDGNMRERLQEEVPLIKELFTGPDGETELECLQSYLQGMRTDRHTEVDPIITQLGPRAEEIVLSTAEKIEIQSRTEGRTEGRAEGRTEGRAEGRTEGRAEGRTEGRAELLLELLAYKFGRPSSAVVQRIRSGMPEQLGRWGQRVLSAGTLDEVFEY